MSKLTEIINAIISFSNIIHEDYTVLITFPKYFSFVFNVASTCWWSEAASASSLILTTSKLLCHAYFAFFTIRWRPCSLVYIFMFLLFAFLSPITIFISHFGHLSIKTCKSSFSSSGAVFVGAKHWINVFFPFPWLWSELIQVLTRLNPIQAGFLLIL